MKLDLLNSRLEIDTGSRVYDSIEGNFISKAAQNGPQNIVAASFRAKGERIETKRRKVPDRFNQQLIDCKSNQIGIKVFKPTLALNSVTNLSGSQNNLNIKRKNKYETIEKQCPSIKLDYIKDRIYNVKEDTVQRRINEGNISGGVWPLQGRKDTPPMYKIGPGSYEVYENLGTNIPGGKFNKQTVTSIINPDKEDFNPDFLPLKVRKRLKRIEDIKAKKCVSTSRIESLAPVHLSNDDLQHSIINTTSSHCVTLNPIAGGGTASIMSHSESIGAVKFNNISRFNNPFYKQEKYVKTSGMLLDLDWDKKLNKKISLNFAKQASREDKHLATNAASVDVDIGHVFSIVNIAAKSPVRYSAAFKSNAKVGMDIPTPTSGTVIGPGSYKDAFKDSIEIKEKDKVSYYMLRGRTSDIKPAAPDVLNSIKSFSEIHTKGPTFDKHSISDGNVELKRIIREKVQKIYPQLAKLKFASSNSKNNFKYSDKIFTAFPKKPKIK